MSIPFKSFEAFALLVGYIATDIKKFFVLKNPINYEFTDKNHWELFFRQNVSIESIVFEGEVFLELKFGGDYRTNVPLPHNDWKNWNMYVNAVEGVTQLKPLLGNLYLKFKWTDYNTVGHYKNLTLFSWDRDCFGFSVDMKNPGEYTALEIVAKIKELF